tara:strand:- start:329 stop:610 length:282 start_codon:yes stop_codon:yes gene_type:complete
LYCYTLEGATIGFSGFWYNNWQPIHPKEVRSLCGSYTAISKEKLGEWSSQIDTQDANRYICNTIVLSSEESYSEHNQQELNFFVGDSDKDIVY